MKPPTTTPAGPLEPPHGPTQPPPYGGPQGSGRPAALAAQQQWPQPGLHLDGGYPPYPSGAPEVGGSAHPPGHQPQHWHPHPDKPGLNTFASLCLLLGLLSLIPFSIAFGIAGLVQIRKTGERGRFYAYTGLAITCLWSAILVLSIVESQNDAGSQAPAQGTPTEKVMEVAPKLRVGDCVATPEGSQPSEQKVQPCTQPHLGKVFAVFDVPSGDYPGIAALQATAEKSCAARYQGGNPAEVFYHIPAPAGWVSGFRTITCLTAAK